MPNPAPCPVCGAALVRTSVEFWCCPHGHGKLVPAVADEDELVWDPLAGGYVVSPESNIDRARRKWLRKLDRAFPRKEE